MSNELQTVAPRQRWEEVLTEIKAQCPPQFSHLVLKLQEAVCAEVSILKAEVNRLYSNADTWQEMLEGKQKEIASLRAASPLPHGGSEWLPIETAPTDGTVVMVWGQLSHYPAAQHVAYSRDGKWYLQATPSQMFRIHDATHWHPALPSPQGETR